MQDEYGGVISVRHETYELTWVLLRVTVSQFYNDKGCELEIQLRFPALLCSLRFAFEKSEDLIPRKFYDLLLYLVIYGIEHAEDHFFILSRDFSGMQMYVL